MDLKYYLDTNAVQSLGAKLESLNSESVFTSIWTQIELVTAFKDESSFRRKRAALKHVLDSGIFVDEAFFPIKRLQAYGLVEPEPYSISAFRKRIIPIALESIDYCGYKARIHDEGLEKHLEVVQIVDDVGSTSNEYLDKNKFEIDDYENKWKGDKEKLTKESIAYHAEKLEEKYFIPQRSLLQEYDKSIDYFMLIHYYYVEQKKHSHDKMAHNDMNDLYHLLYLKKGYKLVTDDKGFQKYVNKMVDGLAIGTEQFLKEINA